MTMKQYFIFLFTLLLCCLNGSIEADSGKITGKVTDLSTGRALSGVTIQAIFGGVTVQSTTTNSEGNYSFNDLTLGTYTVTATFTNYQTASTKITVINTKGLCNFQLVALGSIAGTITNSSSGAAISGATVQAIQSGTVIGSATTNSSGAFTISALPIGSYTLSASASNYQSNSAAITVSIGSNTKSLALTPNTGSLSGFISSSTTILGISGATITVSLNGNTVATATSGLLGAYSISGLAPATYSLSVNYAGYQTATTTATITSNNTTSSNVNLSPLKGILSGVVKDSVSGATIAGATITVKQGSTTIATGTSGAQGTYSIPELSPGNYTVTTTSTNYQSLNSSVTIASNQTTTLNPLLQSLPGSINGLISNSQTSVALAGATVTLSTGSAVVATTTSSSSGSYSLFGVAAGTYTLSVSLNNFVTFSQSVTISANATLTQNCLLTPQVGIVTGIVQDLSSLSLLGGATVDLMQGNTVVATTTTSLVGLYSFSVLPGSYTIRVSKTNYASATVSATVLSNVTATVNITLVASPGTATGTVTDAVTASALSGATVQVLTGSTVVASGTSNASGVYSITGVSPGTYTLSISKANYVTSTAPLVISSGLTTTTNVSLQPQSGTASGQVTNGVTLAAIQGATVEFYQGAILKGSATTNASGNYSLATLVPGSYTLKVSGTNYQTSQQSITVQSNTVTTTNVALQPVPGSISGVVTNAQTSAFLNGATLTLTQGSTVIATTTTNNLGGYGFTNVVPGSYTLAASLTNFTTSSQSITVTTNSVTTQNFSLQPQTGTVSGQISSSLTAGLLANVTVNAFQGSTLVATTSTNASGNYSFNLAPGNYTVTSLLTNYQTISQSATVQSNVTTTLNVSLTPIPGSIAGTVTSAVTTLPLAGVSVTVLQGSATIATAQTNVLGAYTITNLSPGNYTVQFSLNNYQTISQTKTVVTNASITADAALQLQVGSVTGVITNAQTGSPLSGATVTALQGATQIASTTSGANGSYTLPSLPVGTYTISAVGTNFQTAQTVVIVIPNASTTVNLSLQPIPGIVSGFITDATTTNPISGASVSVLQNGIVIGSSLSLANGSYTISGLVPGSYTLVVSATNYQGASQPVTVSSNATTTASVALQASPGGISGFVLTAITSVPISGATVDVLSGSTVLASTTTAANGSYTISGLAPAASGVYTFRASATNFQTSTTTAAIVANVTTPVSFSLSPQPGSLTGTITNSQNGAAVSGANVQILQGLVVAGSAITNSSGSYTISGLAPGSYTVSISASNYQATTRSTNISANATTTVNVALVPSPGSLSGTITDSLTTNPLSLALVSVYNQGVLVTSTTTLIDGSYSISGLAPGNYTITASLTNYQNASVSASIFANQTTPLSLALTPVSGAISGVVQSGATPISGATVTVLKGNTTVATLTTDGSGAYLSSGLAPGSYTVVASASTYQTATKGSIVLSNATSTVNFDLVSQPGTISGVLTDAITHSAIPGVVVTALSGNISVGTTITANDGSYSFAGLTPGAYIITGAAVNYQTLAQGANVQALATTTVNLSLQSQPGSVSGQIIDSVSLAAIAGATVDISQGNVVIASVLTDVNGYYSITGLAPGSYNVVIHATNYQNAFKGCIILPNANSTLNSALVSSPGSISGQVLNNASTALPGAIVNLYAHNLLLATQVADSQGNFIFANLAPGTYTVTAQAGNYQAGSQSVQVNANATSSITFNLLPDPGSCTCTLLDALTSLPLSGANVSLLQSNVVVATSITNELGQCSFLGLAPGQYVVRATLSNYQSVVQGITIQSNLTAVVSLSLQPDPGLICGVINDLITGAAVNGAVVDIIKGNTTVASLTTDSDGAYQFSSLAPGIYSIRVSASNYQTTLQTSTILANLTTTLNLGLQPTPGNISVTVVDVSATAVAGVLVTVSNPLNNTPIATALTDASGSCLISGLAPGLYNVVATALNYQNITLSASVVANVTVPLSITLQPDPGSISCLVQDSVSHLPLVGCLCEALNGTTVIASAITDSLGTCLLSGLSPGSYTVRTTLGSYQISTKVVIVKPNIQVSVLFSLLSDTGGLEGEVVDFLSALILPQAQLSLFSGETLVATTYSDALGNYVFTDIAPGTYTLRVTLLNFEILTLTVTITANHTTHQPCSMHSQPGNITGAVTDASTTLPIAGAQITVLNGTTTVANVLTDSSGNYTVTGLSTQVNYTVRCTATNYQTSIQGATVQANQTKTVNFALQSSPGNISGLVTDSVTAAAIAGATVDLLQGSVTIATTQTDTDGNYQLSALAPGVYTLRVGKNLYQTVLTSAQVQANQTTTVNVTLQANPGILQGTVTDSFTSQVLPNTQVQVRNGSLLIASATTDQNGQYSIPGLAPGQYSVTATMSNHQTVTKSVSIQSNATATLNFALQPNPGTIIGQITSGGAPLSGATLSVYQGSNLIGTATSDSDGNYLVGNLAPGQYTVVASADLYQNASQGIRVESNQSTSANFALLSQPGSITGIVTGAAASIDLMQGSSIIASTVTANDGSYSFNNLAPGSYTVRAEAQNYQTVVRGATVAANATTTVNITLQAQPGTISGTVVDDFNSNPLSGVTIELIQNSVVVESALTDGSGTYVLSELAPGSYYVRATIDDYQIALQGVNVQSNVTVTANFSLKLLPGNIAGQITDATTGSLLVDTQVDVFQGAILIATTITDGNGNYTVSNLAPGNYTVRASLNNYETSLQSATVTATDTTTVNFTLTQQPGSVVGQITDALTTQPISTAAVSVSILQSNVLVGSVLVDSDGNYSINGLSQGNYTLKISAPTYQTSSQGLTIYANTTTVANVALQPQPGAIAGTIIDQATNQPLVGATVEIMQGSVIFESVLTDANGTYVANQLAPGSYTVRVSATNYQTGTQNATVLANATTSSNLQLMSDPGSISGTVTDSTGTPLSGAFVVIKKGNVSVGSVVTDASGNYSVPGLAPGTYSVSVSLTNYQSAFNSIAVTANATSQLSFALISQPGSCSGLVIDAITTQPIASATVDFLQNGFIVATVLSDANGNYTLDGLAPGQYTIRATVVNYQIASQGVAIFSNQTTNVNFALQPFPGSVAGIITDSQTSNAIANASIQIYQGQVLISEGSTDVNGAYALSSLSPGNYTAVISAPNYQSLTQGFAVQSNAAAGLNAALTANPATITGTVTDALTSALLANASIQVLRGSTLIGSTLSDSSGLYTISGLALGSYTLSVLSTNYQSTTVSFIATASQTLTENIALNANPGSLSGNVTDSSTTTPLAGATVTIKQGAVVITSQVTDTDGNWIISNLAPGSYTIVIGATSYQTSTLGATVQPNFTSATTISLTANPGEVTGQVSSSSVGLSGATVDVLQNNVVVGSAITDNAGNYTINSLAPGSYSIRATSANYNTVVQGLVIASNQQTTVNLALNPNPGSISGQIIDSNSSQPLSGITINVIRSNTLIASALTDANGNYRIDNLSPGSYTLTTASALFQVATQGAIVSSNQTQVVNLSLLDQPGTLSGQITDQSNGLSLSGALISVLNGSNTLATVLTDSNGNYVISGLAPGSYTVRVTLNTYQTVTQSALVSAAAVTSVNIALQSNPGSVTGQVKNTIGDPITGGSVVLHVIQGNVVLASTLTDSSGVYLIENLQPGNYSLSVMAGGYQSSVGSINIQPGLTTTLDFTLASQPGNLAGTIQDSTGPIIGATIQVFSNTTLLASVLSDSSGNYQISNLAPGQYVLHVIATNYQGVSKTVTISANATTTSNLTLIPNPGSITGNVVDSNTGLPLVGILVNITKNSTLVATALTDSEGNFVIAGLAPDTYSIVASGGTYQTSAYSVSVTAGNTTVVNFSLQSQPGVVSGIITDSNSIPIANALVEVLQGTNVLASAETDANGNYTLNGLAPGSYVIRVTADLFQIAVQGTTVVAGGQTSANIILQDSPGSISGVIKDANSQAGLEAAVTIFQGGVQIATTLSQSNGQYTISSLPTGNYIIQAVAADYQIVQQGVTITPNGSVIANFSLLPSPGAIQGVVVDSITTLPINGASVTLFSGSSFVTNVQTDATGNYTLSNLAPGSYTVTVSASTYETATQGAQVSSLATTTLNFSLSSQPGTISGTITDQSLQPIAGAQITVLLNQQVVVSALTDVNGNYSITGLSPNSYTVAVNAANFQLASQGATVTANANTNIPFSLSSTAGNFSINVVDALSQPLSGATVEILQNQSILFSTLTDGSGNAAINNLAPGNYTVRVSLNGYQTAIQVGKVTSSTTTSLSFSLVENPGTLSGVIQDQSTSTALANALVEVLQGNTVIASALTASDGSFTISSLASGNYTVRVGLQNYQTLVVGTNIISGQTTSANVSLTSNPGFALGAVTDVATGLGLPGALVEILQNSVVIATQQTDSNGNYTINNLAPGTYLLRASATNYQVGVSSVIIIASQNTVVNVTLQNQPGTVTGAILSNLTQAPLSNATVNIYSGALLVATVLTDTNGEYTVEGLASGNYQLNVQADGYQTAVSAFVVNSGGTTQLNFSLSNLTGSVTGVALDSQTSNPIAGATVSIYQGNSLITSVLTDTNGQYNLPNLSPGTYNIVTSAANYQTSIQTLTVQSGSPISNNISLTNNPGTINGQIADSNTLLPVQGVTIQVSSGQVVIASTITDSQGQYAINNLPAGNYVVTISGPNYQTVVQSLILAPSQTSTISLSLQPSPGVLSGNVSDALSQPLVNATVYVLQGSTLISSTLTDSLGNYSIDGIPEGNFTVEAVAAGYQFGTSSLNVTAGSSNTVNFILQQNPGSIQGNATDGTNPIAGAAVLISRGDIVVASTFTDNQGNFFVTNLPDGSYTVQVSATNFQTGIQGIQVAANVIATTNFTLQTLPSSIVGTVTSDTLLPFPGMRVTTYSNNIPVLSVLTNVNGQYVLNGLAPGNYVVKVEAPDYQTAVSGILLAPNTTATVNFVLSPQPGSIIGVAKDANGNPLSGVVVTILQNNVVISTVTTGQDGSYTVAGLAPGSYTATVAAPAYQTNTQGIVVIPNNSVALDFTLQAQPSSIAGTALDVGSAPISGAQIAVLQNGSIVATAVTANDGSFNIAGLGTGSYVVVISASQFQTTSIGIILAAGQELNLTVTLLADIGAIQGVVQDTSSLPLANATIIISQSSIVITTVIADSNGAYTVPNLPPNTYVVTCSLPNYQTSSQGAIVVANTTTTANFTLSANVGQLEGYINDFAQGTPVSNATIYVISQGVVVASATTDANGYYLVSGLAPGSYTFSVQAAAYQTSSQSVAIQTGNTTQTSISMNSSPGSIQGVVQSEQTPIVNAVVSVTVLQGNTVISSSLTDANGGYLLSGLKPGNYVVKASAAGYQIQVQGVIVTADQTTTVNFSLTPNPGAISGTVLDASASTPIAGALVQILQGSVLVTSGLTDTNGNFLFNNFAPGSYTISAGATNYQIGTTSIQVVSNQTATTTISLQNNPGTVTGTVIDSNTSDPIPGAVVDILQGLTLISSTLTDSLGGYTINQLSPGSYTIRATASNYQPSVQGCIISAGATVTEDFALDIQPSNVVGTVIDADTEEAIAGALVIVVQDNNIIANALTDSSGMFSISELAAGTYSIQFSRMNYQNNVTGLTLNTNETRNVNIALQPNPGSIQGSVKDTLNQPITGAFVSVDILKGNILVAQALTDMNGLYTIPNLGEGSYVIQASATNYQTAVQGAIVISNQVTTIDFVLQANPGAINGTIMDANTAAGIVGATVSIFSGPVRVGTAITDSNGGYSVTGLAPGSYSVRASADNYQSGTLIITVLSNSTTTADLALQSNPGTIVGIITDSDDGDLLEGAIVDVSQNGTTIASALSGSDGSYQISGLPVGNYIITVTAASYQTVTIGVSVLAGETVTQNLSLSPNAGQLTGHVQDTNTSQPIANALINVLQNNIIIASVLTNSQGDYLIQNLAVGTFTVRISATNFETSIQTATIVSNQTTNLYASLQANPGALQGIITDVSTSQPLANINVQVFQGLMLIAETITDSTGQYTITGLASGTYTVNVGGQGFAISTATTIILSNQTTPLNFTLTTLQGSVSGIISEAGTGNRILGAHIDIFSGATLIAFSATDVNGLYTFSLLPPGTYTLRVSADNYQTLTTQITVVDGEITVQDLLLDPLPGSISGQVFDAYSGAPLQGVTVIIFGGNDPIATTQTDALGNYSLTGLAPGGYTIQFSFANYDVLIEDIIIQTNTNSVFNVALEPFPSSPSTVKQCQIVVRFLMQKEIKNRIQWTAPQSPGIVAYRIYRDGLLLAEVPAYVFFYEDHKIKKNADYTYQVAAVNSFGLESPLAEAEPSQSHACSCE